VALGKTDEAIITGRHLLQLLPGFRMSHYARLCPFRGKTLTVWLERLRQGGLPE
jgi:adenylate cyclase